MTRTLAEADRVAAVCVGLHVRRASRVLTQIYDQALKPTGLVLSQFTVLVAVHQGRSASVGQLAERLLSDQTTLTRNLKILAKRQLVALAPGEDRRLKLVSLTAAGEQVLATALPLWATAQAAICQQLGSDKTEALLTLLAEVQILARSEDSIA